MFDAGLLPPVFTERMGRILLVVIAGVAIEHKTGGEKHDLRPVVPQVLNQAYRVFHIDLVADAPFPIASINLADNGTNDRVNRLASLEEGWRYAIRDPIRQEVKWEQSWSGGVRLGPEGLIAAGFRQC